MPLQNLQPSFPRPVYSPRSPLLRAFIVTLVAGFVICHESFSRLFKAKGHEVPLVPDASTTNLSHNAIR
jgi:hypothetical protein